MPRALFLDRDGVINKDINYLYRIEDVEWVDGIFEVCRLFQTHGFEIFVVTNQAGIARGLYTEADFWKLTEWMVAEFSQQGVTIRKVYFCPYHATAGIGAYRRVSNDRKPNPGMILRAQREFRLDLPSSYLIGDKESDIQAGRNAGVGTNILLAPPTADTPQTQADVVVHSLRDLPSQLNLG